MQRIAEGEGVGEEECKEWKKGWNEWQKVVVVVVEEEDAKLKKRSGSRKKRRRKRRSSRRKRKSSWRERGSSRRKRKSSWRRRRRRRRKERRSRALVVSGVDHISLSLSFAGPFFSCRSCQFFSPIVNFYKIF